MRTTIANSFATTKQQTEMKEQKHTTNLTFLVIPMSPEHPHALVLALLTRVLGLGGRDAGEDAVGLVGVLRGNGGGRGGGDGTGGDIA